MPDNGTDGIHPYRKQADIHAPRIGLDCNDVPQPMGQTTGEFE